MNPLTSILSPFRKGGEKVFFEFQEGLVGVAVRPAAVLTVVIGTYGSEERAWEAVDTLEETKLGTEKYVGKALQVLAGEDNIFYVTYGESTTEEEANKIFRLLKINDKKISPKILRLD